MKIAVVGGGIAGLSAAYDLLAAGHAVTVYEASAVTGGLAAGFRDERWSWPLEHFYHHLFAGDDAILDLVSELGIRDRVFFPTPRTSIWHQGQIYPFSNPIDWFRFPGYNPWDFFRFGVVGAFLRYTRVWRWLEKETAVEWARRWYGKKITDISWKPLLIGKFGAYYDQVNMAWLWARLHVRSFQLGYFEGGFQFFVDTLTAAVASRGGQIRLQTPVTCLRPAAGGAVRLTADGEDHVVDQVLFTGSPGLLGRLAPDLPPAYLAGLRQLRSMGAVVLVLALRHSLMADSRTYWLNLPAETPDKSQTDIPFLALVEHTNYIDRKHYGGDHLVYCGDYVKPDHAYFRLEETALKERFVAALPRINPAFRPEWIRKWWLFRAPYAQPVPLVNHSRHVPEIPTPLPGLYFASMSQVYPWDRGTNYAVEIGRRAARLMGDGAAAGAD